MAKNILMLLAVFFTSSAAVAEINVCNPIPYIGIDVGWRHMDYKRGLGTNLFARGNVQNNIYLGLKFSRYLGFEVGYEASVKRTKKTSNAIGTIELGDILQETIYSSNTTQVQGCHINLVGFFPIDKQDCFQFVGSIGICYLHIELRHRPLAINGIALSNSISDRCQANFKNNKVVAQCSVGVQQMLTSNLGIRLQMLWENTEKLRNLSAKRAQMRVLAGLKNSTAYTLGLFLKFN